MYDSIHEECGVFGIYTKEKSNVAADVYYGLFALQHRGQESCGIVVNDDGVMTGFKDVGLVNDVFSLDVLNSLGMGHIAVGHVRYGMKATVTRTNAQPITINHIKGSMALATNGNIINADELRGELELTGSIFHTTSDSEIIAAVIIKKRLASSSIEEAILKSMGRLKGAYSMVIMSPKKLIGVRDPRGFRPLCIGRLNGDYVLSSETCGLDAVGATFLRDVEPGEIVIIDEDGLRSITDYCNTEKKSLCVFEYIYFARPDSILDGTSVHQARRKAGALLALDNPINADVVVGVPDSGLDAAMGYSHQSGIPYGLGFVKNKYIGRTFTHPDQKYRETRVRIKLNVVTATVKGKRVIMVDDSIVRGTTSARIVKLLRNAGATEVHVRSSAPAFMNPCYFGTDIDSRENLIAYNYSIGEITKMIGADSLAFLNIRDIPKLMDAGCSGICDACFTGKYPMEVPENAPSVPKSIKKICKE